MPTLLVAGAALLGAANAGAEGRPISEGGLSFRTITSPADAGAFYKEGGWQASTLTALEAHDAQGATVPTSLAQTGPDVITLTVSHREGNPAAGGAPFSYSISEGAGWEGGYRTISFPLVEPTPSAGASAAAEAHPAQPQQVRVVRALGEDKLYYRPHFFLLSGDGTFGMNRVHWQSYGGARATATARAFVNDCVPYCAAGHVSHPRATLRLSKLVDCNGTPIYARLEYAIAGPLPKGFPRRGGYSMRPLGEDGKPEC